MNKGSIGSIGYEGQFFLSPLKRFPLTIDVEGFQLRTMTKDSIEHLGRQSASEYLQTAEMLSDCGPEAEIQFGQVSCGTEHIHLGVGGGALVNFKQPRGQGPLTSEDPQIPVWTTSFLECVHLFTAEEYPYIR